MCDIVVSDDLCRSLTQATGEIRLVTAAGEVLGRFEPELTAEEMAEIRRRLAAARAASNFVKPEVCPFSPDEVAAAEKEADSPGPWYTTQQVLEHLRSLDRPQP